MSRLVAFRRALARTPLLEATLVFLAAALLLAAAAQRAEMRRSQKLRTFKRSLVVPSERSYKADLIEKLAKPPELVFFGGSRSERFDPALARRLTGLRAFNLALTNSRPEDAYAFARWLLRRAPGTKLHWVWGMQTSTFYDRDLDAGLIQDQRFSWSFPDELIASQRERLPKTRAQMPKSSFLHGRRYARNGLLLWNAYDSYEAHGRTLAESLEDYIRDALKKQRQASGGGSGGISRARTYFEKTLKLLNDHGVRPLIVSMPVHPEALAALRPNGWDRSHGRFVAYIDSLKDRYDFTFLDLTEISSFDGDPAQFYDGVHIKRANAAKVLEKMVEAAPEAFK